jgi:hypothetical protein
MRQHFMTGLCAGLVACAAFGSGDTDAPASDGGADGAGEGGVETDGDTPDGAARPPRVYVLGGQLDTGAGPRTFVNSKDVLFADVDPSGALSAWEPGPKLPTLLQGNAAAVVGDIVLSIGGGAGATPETNVPTAEVWRARSGPDGVLGAWEDGGPLPAVRGRGAAVTAGGRVYAIGGGNVTSVLVGTPSEGGAVHWAETAPLPEIRNHLGAVTDGRLVYVVGGFHVSGAMNVCPEDVLVSEIQLDGTLSPWRASGARLPARGAAPALRNGKLYAVGGMGCDGVLTTEVVVASFGDDGTADPFVPATPLPDLLWGAAAAPIGDHLFVLGGNSGDTNTNTVLRARVEDDGSLDEWETVSTLPHRLAFFGFAVR